MALTKAQRAEREELAAQGLKRCAACKDIKEHSEFNKDKTKWDGFQSYCSFCQSNKLAAYREDNQEKIRQQQLAYREANRDKERERMRKYREANRELERERVRKYNHARRDADPLWQRFHNGAKRARKAGCEIIPFNSKDLLAYWEVNSISSENCYYCNSEFNGFFHLDHKIPFSNGGHHSVDNLVPACAKCNTFKQSMTAEEFSTSISDVNQ